MLARHLRLRADSLRADFQQFYGLDIDGMGTAFSLAHAAALAAQLPHESRCYRAEHPEAAWTDAEYMLAEIAHGIATLVWQPTKSGRKGINRPKRIQTPAERAAAERRFKSTDFDYIDKVLGGAPDG